MNKLLLCICLVIASQVALQAQIEWMTWQEAMVANEKEPRKILVDVYTDWCGWCKRMDANTFSDKSVGDSVGDKFYAVKLNAEQQDPIQFRGKTYTFEAGGRRGVHGLAKELLQGRLGYPTVVFLDESVSLIQPVPGYQDAEAMTKIVDYIGNDVYKSRSWADFTGQK